MRARHLQHPPWPCCPLAGCLAMWHCVFACRQAANDVVPLLLAALDYQCSRAAPACRHGGARGAAAQGLLLVLLDLLQAGGTVAQV